MSSLPALHPPGPPTAVKTDPCAFCVPSLSTLRKMWGAGVVVYFLLRAGSVVPLAVVGFRVVMKLEIMHVERGWVTARIVD